MRDAAGADDLDTVTVEITRAGEESEMRVPMDFRKALAAAPLAKEGWEDITPMARRDWIFSISSAEATGNAQAADRESVRHACLREAAIVLFSRYKVDDEKKRKIMRDVASFGELTKSFFAAIDKVETVRLGEPATCSAEGFSPSPVPRSATLNRIDPYLHIHQIRV